MALILYNRAKVIHTICRLAIDLASLNKSFFQLVEASGVSSLSQPISANEISDYLRRDPDLVSAWLAWSADKRTSTGPYFSEREGNFEVGVLCGDGTCSVLGQFEDRVEACGVFLEQELAARHTCTR